MTKDHAADTGLTGIKLLLGLLVLSASKRHIVFFTCKDV